MKKLRLNTFTLVALILFISAMGARRIIMRDQVEDMREAVEDLRAQKDLQHKIDELMRQVVKSDDDLRGLIITRDIKFLNGFDDRVETLNSSFADFMELAVAQKVLTASDTALMDSLLQQKILFMKDVRKLCGENHFEEAAAKISTGMGKVLLDFLKSMVFRTDSELESLVESTEQEYAEKGKSEAVFSSISYILLMLLLAIFLLLLYLEIRKNQKIKSQLAEREEKLSITLTGIGDGVLTTDKNGNVTYLNPVAESLLAFKLHQVEGTHIKQVFKITDESSGESIEGMYDQVIAKGIKLETQNHTVLHSHGDKKYIIESNATPLRDHLGEILGMVLIFRDVTERRKNVLALTEAEKELRSIFDNTREGIYRSTLEGKLLLVNPSMVKIFDYESEEQMLQSVEDLGQQLYLNQSDRDIVIAQLKQYGRIEGYEVEVKTLKGRTIWIVVNAHTVNKENGQINYVEGTIADVTGRKLDQVKLERQYEALKLYAFINSHEVRAHVATILGLSKLCIDQYVSEEEKSNVITHMYNETNKLDSVVRKLSVIVSGDV